jgi:hypothetical protein
VKGRQDIGCERHLATNLQKEINVQHGLAFIFFGTMLVNHDESRTLLLWSLSSHMLTPEVIEVLTPRGDVLQQMSLLSRPLVVCWRLITPGGQDTRQTQINA